MSSRCEKCTEGKMKLKCWRETGASILFFAITLLIVLIVCIRKDVWFCDEVYTYRSANAGADFRAVFKNDEWISGKDVVAAFSAKEYSLKFNEIAETLFKDHVPLYFWAFRIASLIGFGSISKWIGLGLNIAILIPLFVGMVWLIRELSGTSYVVSGLTTSVCLVHPLFLSEITTIRMYLLFSLFQVLFIIAVIKNENDVKSFLRIGLVAVLGLLTHYHFWIWIGFFSVLYLLSIIMREQRFKIKKCILFIITMICSLGITTIIFPFWIRNVLLDTSTKGYSSFTSLSMNWGFSKDIIGAVSAITSLLAHSLRISVVVLFVVTAAAYLIITKKRNKNIVIITGLSCLLLSIVIQHSQPTVEKRYLWPSSLIFLIIFFVSLMGVLEYIISTRRIENKALKKALSVIILFCFFILNLNNSFKNDFSRLSQYVRYRSVEEHDNILAEDNNPWIVFYNNENWRLYCSMFDFSIPGQIKRVRDNDSVKPDSVLRNSDDVIIFVDNKTESIVRYLDYIEGCAGKQVKDYDRISHGYALIVYKIHFTNDDSISLEIGHE